MRHFYLDIIFTLIALAVASWWGLVMVGSRTIDGLVHYCHFICDGDFFIV